MGSEETTKKAINPTEKIPFVEYVDDKDYAPNKTLERKLNSNDFPFSKNKFFSFNPPLLASDEFNRCVELYKNRGENGSIMDAVNMMSEMAELESPHKNELEELAIRVVREMYNVPEEINLRAFLKKEDFSDEMEDQTDDDEKEEKLTKERKEELIPEIEKRRILNSIVHGAAIHQWTSAFYIASEELDEINPELISKYNKYAALIQYWNWQMYYEPMFDQGMAPMVQGINKLNIKKKEINAMAINFPVLIHELSKGVIDFLISKGIPDLPPEELKYIYREADNYAHEQWHYMLAPTLWRALLETSQLESSKLAPIISELSQMDYESLSDTCIDITFFSETAGKRAMNNLKK